MNLRSLFLILALGTAPVLANEPACTPLTPVDTYCQIPIDAVHPTQSAVGELQVADSLATVRRQSNLAAWQKKSLIPVIIGPDGSFYLTDRHHTSRSLWESGAATLLVKVIGRLNTPATFWPDMQAHQWVYLFNERGQPISPAELPRRIADMRNDPYRSLAGFAQKKGYFEKTGAYFIEFSWARYFGMAMHWQPIDAGNLAERLSAAQVLACAPEARDLPGYAATTCAAAGKPAR